MRIRPVVRTSHRWVPRDTGSPCLRHGSTLRLSKDAVKPAFGRHVSKPQAASRKPNVSSTVLFCHQLSNGLQQILVAKARESDDAFLVEHVDSGPASDAPGFRDRPFG